MTTDKKTWLITGAGRGQIDAFRERSSSLALDEAETAAAAS